MKKFSITVLLISTILSLSFAQAVPDAPGGKPGQGPKRTQQESPAKPEKSAKAEKPEKPEAPAKPEITKVSGTLALVKGRIAVQAKDAVYFTNGLQRLVGFVDGFKEGASVTLEGYVAPLPKDAKDTKIRFIHTTKLSFNGKDYELGGDQPQFYPQVPDKRPEPKKLDDKSGKKPNFNKKPGNRDLNKRGN